MAFKILTDGGYDIVFDINVAREYIGAYRACGIYKGMKFMPFLKSGSDIHETY